MPNREAARTLTDGWLAGAASRRAVGASPEERQRERRRDGQRDRERRHEGADSLSGEGAKNLPCSPPSERSGRKTEGDRIVA